MNFFNNNKGSKFIIGSLHLPPLLGVKGHRDFEKMIKRVLSDLSAFQNGGVDAVIYENNYDIPHKEFLSSPQVAEMAKYGMMLKKASRIPLGISTLWNDYITSLSIASLFDLKFVRVPVFVDKVKTDYGVIEGNSKAVIETRKQLRAENVLIFTDIHVKHAKLISSMNLVESARMAIKSGSDALILTGGWTGDVPDINQLKILREAVKNFPIIIGSGVDVKNIKELFQFADGVIVSTSLKERSRVKHSANIRPYSSRILVSKVRELVRLSKGSKYNS